MNTVVIYHSQTGFTERYAKWLAEATGADCFALADAKKQDLSAYETVVFGSWARAGSISKLEWFRKNIDRWAGKRLVVFCVGGSPADSPDVAAALRRGFSDAEWEKVRAFYCPGGMNYEKMSAPSRLLMKAFVSGIKAKKSKTASEQAMAELISSSYDLSDRKYLAPILRYLGD